MLARKPSEYLLSGNCWFSAEADEGGLAAAIDALGEDQVVIATDYPHFDCEFPHTTEHLVDASGRHWVHPAEPSVGADRRHRPPTVVDHDAHIHRELTALLGAGGATIRTSSGVFARIDDLDHALATIAAATWAAATDPR